MSNFEEMAEDIGQKDGKYVVTADQDLTKYNVKIFILFNIL